jgi:imidazolonepropionase
LLAHSGAGVDLASELKAVRATLKAGKIARVSAAFEVVAHSPDFRENAAEYVQWTCDEILPKVSARNLAKFAHAVCEPAGYSLEDARTLLVCAQRLGLRISLEGDITARLGVTQLATDLDVKHVTGLNYADSYDATLLSRSKTVVVLRPCDVVNGRSTQVPPARPLIDSGAAVAISAGFHPTLPSVFSMPSVLSFACRHLGLTTEEAITAATINAAHAIDMEQTTGSLQFGKSADLLIMDVPDYRAIPYDLGVNLVHVAIRGGDVIYREGEVRWNDK